VRKLIKIRKLSGRALRRPVSNFIVKAIAKLTLIERLPLRASPLNQVTQCGYSGFVESLRKL